MKSNMTQLHHQTSYTCSLIIAIARKAKYRFRAATMLLVYITQKITLTEVSYFLRSITIQNSKCFYCSSQFTSSHGRPCMLVLFMVGNYKLGRLGGF
jgi:hypothetical protein